MTIKKLLTIGYNKVNNRNDVRDLLSHMLGIRFEQLIIRSDDEVSSDIENTYLYNIERLSEGYPLAYILGERQFYHRTFMVSPNVLIPREETEMLVDIAKKEQWDNALDLCTGSGIIGITLQLETKKKVTLSDVSLAALEVATNNAKSLDADVEIVASDLFECIEGTFDLIVSNPPYIRKQELANLPLLQCEPQNALDGGDDGLYFYEQILLQAKEYLSEEGIIIFETGYDQLDDISDLALKYGYRVEQKYKDVYGLDRFIKVSK